MILKASQRGGAKQLGLHLLRTDENEHVEVHDIRGFVSDDLVGALKEAYAVSKGTRCRQFLFSVSLSPPPNERVPVEIFETAITRIEERNGLTGQPRVIVFHEKEGRRHAHAVWSRIDAETMTARNLPYFKLKLRDLSRELYMEHGWKMPRGLMNSREADPRNFTLAEWQQAKRMGRDARDVKALMQECWAASDAAAAFAQALKARGFSLAKGDRRGHVALTPEGEVLSLSRYTGKKVKEIEARLGKPASLPSIAEARTRLAQDLSATFKRHMREAEELKRRDLAPLEVQRQGMVEQHRQERSSLQTRQTERWAGETRERAARIGKGLQGLWNRIMGRQGDIQRRNEQEAYTALVRDREQRQALIDAQMMDRQALQEKIRAVRDRHATLLRELRTDREALQHMARQPEAVKDFAKEAGLRPTMGQRLEGLRNMERETHSKTPFRRDFDRER
ncbi:relaxase/mobilization nuclease domain-containing protein [Xanthobacter autotrophicus]|uniref:relaxase/mobilization nuclease domain-containing protein n=1 Tax=Xanthobacter TaxID=279 RepID=UPI0024AB270C|nr:relaxase/mobilization nuclease domain-containing protein [Xanthobacter autotrophicus]MDI4665401.1 relaxase/mobilization nuclease domain-containing protein [Xanthobacter autotrophicus]